MAGEPTCSYGHKQREHKNKKGPCRQCLCQSFTAIPLDPYH